MIKHLPTDICHQIYDILVEHTDAIERFRDDFVRYYGDPDNPVKPTEYRGCPRWGIAGKFWWNNDRFYVTGRSPVECSTRQIYERELTECEEVNRLLDQVYKRWRTGIENDYQQPDWRIDEIPEWGQYQGSLQDQLQFLTRVANRLGLRDAADYIQRSLDRE